MFRPGLVHYSGLLGGGALLLAVLLIRRRRWGRRPGGQDRRLVVITGCDSGIGYSLALRLVTTTSLHVFAGVLNPALESLEFLQSVGAENSNLTLWRLDITDGESVSSALGAIEKLSKDLGLAAVINNAGVMIFGEMEWFTEDLVWKLLEVNLLGTIRFTKALQPLLRQNKGRILNVTSHCAHTALPGLAVYCATKAGLRAWSDSLRVELKKFEVPVVQIVPGSYVTQSKIMGNQAAYAKQMEAAMSLEARSVYGEYFNRYMDYLLRIPVAKYPSQIDDENLYNIFEDALFSSRPKHEYINSPLRYTVYHTLFSLSPTWLKDILVTRYVSMPEWKV